MELASQEPHFVTAPWMGVSASGISGLAKCLDQGFPEHCAVAAHAWPIALLTLASLKQGILVPAGETLDHSRTLE